MKFLTAFFLLFSIEASSQNDLILPKEKVDRLKSILPRVDDLEVQFILQSQDTVWYDETAIVPGYQDSQGDPEGMRPNTIDQSLINLAVPGGWQRLFEFKGRFRFPFGTGGADSSPNFKKFNFWVPTKEPVVYWKLPWSRWQWLFPVGTIFGEILVLKMSDGEEVVFEVRTRKRHIDHWENDLFRPFTNYAELLIEIKEKDPDWSSKPKLVAMIEHLNNQGSLVSKEISTVYYRGSIDPISGMLDPLPDFGDANLVKKLLKETSFKTAKEMFWKMGGNGSTYAPTTSLDDSIVPKNYDGGLLDLTDESCRRCHDNAGRQIGDFQGELILYGEIWGEDEIFSWHPFENEMFVNPDGSVKNFNNDNRRLRKEFQGLVVPFDRSKHPETIYKALPRNWTYRPIN